MTEILSSAPGRPGESLATLLAPLDGWTAEPARARDHFARAGWDLDAALDAGALERLLSELEARLQQVAPAAGPAATLELLGELGALFTAAATPRLGARAAELGADFMETLYLDWLERHAPHTLRAAELLGLIVEREPELVVATSDGVARPARRGTPRRTLTPERARELVADPFRVLASAGVEQTFSGLAAAHAAQLGALADASGRHERVLLSCDEHLHVGGTELGVLHETLTLALPDARLALVPEPGGARVELAAAPPLEPVALFEERGFLVESRACGGHLTFTRSAGLAELGLEGGLSVGLPLEIASTRPGERVMLPTSARALVDSSGVRAFEPGELATHVPRLKLGGGPVLHDARVTLVGLRLPLGPELPPRYALVVEGELELGAAPGAVRVAVRGRYDGTGFDLESRGALDLGGGLRVAPVAGRPVWRQRVESLDESGEHLVRLEGALLLPQAGGCVPVRLAGELTLDGTDRLHARSSSVRTAFEPGLALTLPGRIQLREPWVRAVIAPRDLGGELGIELGGRAVIGEAEVEIERASVRFPDHEDPRVIEIEGEGGCRPIALFPAAHVLDGRVSLRASTRGDVGELRLLDATVGLFPCAAPLGTPARERFEILIEGLVGSFRFGGEGFTLPCESGRLSLPIAFDTNGRRSSLSIADATSPLVLAWHPSARPAHSFSGTLEFGGPAVDLSAEGERGAPRAEIERARLVFSNAGLPRVEGARGRITFTPPGARRGATGELRFEEFAWELSDLPAGPVELERDLAFELGGGFTLSALARSPESGRRAELVVARDEDGYARFELEGDVELALPPELIAGVSHDPDGSPRRGGAPLALRAWTRFVLPLRPGARADLGELELETTGAFRLGERQRGLLVTGRVRTVGLTNALSPTTDAPFALELDGELEVAAPGPRLALDGARFELSGARNDPRFVPPTLAGCDDQGAAIQGLDATLADARFELVDARLPLTKRLAPENLALTLTLQLALAPEAPVERAQLANVRLALDDGRARLALDDARLALAQLAPVAGCALTGELQVGERDALRDAPRELLFYGLLDGQLHGADVRARVALQPARALACALEESGALEEGGAPLDVPLGASGLVVRDARGGVLFRDGADDAHEPLRAVQSGTGAGGPRLLWRNAGGAPRAHGPELSLRGRAGLAHDEHAFALEGRARSAAGRPASLEGALWVGGLEVGRAQAELAEAGEPLRGTVELALGALACGPAQFELAPGVGVAALSSALRTRLSAELRGRRGGVVRIALGARASEIATLAELARALDALPASHAVAALCRLARAARAGDAGAARAWRAVQGELETTGAAVLRLRANAAPRWFGLPVTHEPATHAGVALRGRAADDTLQVGFACSPAALLSRALGGEGALVASDQATFALSVPFAPSGGRHDRATLLDVACPVIALDAAPFGLRCADLRARWVPPALDGADVEPVEELELDDVALANGGLVGAGELRLPELLGELAPTALLARAVDRTLEPAARLRALRSWLGRERGGVAACGPVAFFVPAPTAALLGDGSRSSGALLRALDAQEHAPRADGAFFRGRLSGRVFGLALEDAPLHARSAGDDGDEPTLVLEASAPEGSWVASLQPDARFELTIRRAPRLAVEDGLQLCRALAARAPRHTADVDELLEPLRVAAHATRARLFTAVGLVDGELREELEVEPGPESRDAALGAERAELVELARELSAARGARAETLRVDWLTERVARSLPRVSLFAGLDALRLPPALAPALAFVGDSARLEAWSALAGSESGEAPNASLPESLARVRRCGGVALCGDLLLGHALGLKLRIPDAALSVEPSDSGFPVLSGEFELPHLPLPFGLPALERARVSVHTITRDGAPRFARDGFCLSGRLGDVTVELGLRGRGELPTLVGAVPVSIPLENTDLGPIFVPGTELRLADRVRLSGAFTGICDLELAPGAPRATLTGEFEWNGYTWGIPALELDVRVERPRALRERLVAHLRQHAALILGEAFDDLGFWLESLRSGAIQLDERRAPELARVLHARELAPAAVARALDRAGFEPAEVASGLFSALGPGALPQVALALHDAYGFESLSTAALALEVSAGAERRGEVAGALIAAYGEDSLVELARTWRRALGASSLPAAARALREACGDASLATLARALRAAYGAGKLTAIATALVGASGSGGDAELARALRTAWPRTRPAAFARALRRAFGDAVQVSEDEGPTFGHDELERVALALRAELGTPELALALRAAFGAQQRSGIAGALARAGAPLYELAIALELAFPRARTAALLDELAEAGHDLEAVVSVASELYEATPESLATWARTRSGGSPAWIAARLRELGLERDDAAFALHVAGCSAAAVCQALLGTYFEDVASAAMALWCAGFSCEDAAQALHEVFECEAGVTARALGDVGFPSREVARGLKASYTVEPGVAARAMSLADYRPEEIVEALSGVFVRKAEEAAAALRDARIAPREIGRVMRVRYTRDPKRAARVLETAHFSPEEVKAALARWPR